MKQILLIGIAITFTVAAPVFAGSPASPKVVVNALAAVSGDNITLGDIANITPSPQTCKASARLAATIVGRAPLPGTTRALNRGDICLKLRQAGIDPNTVDIEGAANLTVSQTETAQDAAAPSGESDGSTPAGPVVKAGDEIDIVLVDGPVIVRAKGFAMSSGAIGDRITVRRDGAPHPLNATIIDAGRAELEE